MLNFFYKKNKIYHAASNHDIDVDIDQDEFKIPNEIITDAIYRLLYHKISNYIEISEIEINSLLLLPYEKKIKIIKLFNDCIKNLISYNDICDK